MVPAARESSFRFEPSKQLADFHLAKGSVSTIHLDVRAEPRRRPIRSNAAYTSLNLVGNNTDPLEPVPLKPGNDGMASLVICRRPQCLGDPTTTGP